MSVCVRACVHMTVAQRESGKRAGEVRGELCCTVALSPHRASLPLTNSPFRVSLKRARLELPGALSSGRLAWWALLPSHASYHRARSLDPPQCMLGASLCIRLPSTNDQSCHCWQSQIHHFNSSHLQSLPFKMAAITVSSLTPYPFSCKVCLSFLY